MATRRRCLLLLERCRSPPVFVLLGQVVNGAKLRSVFARRQKQLGEGRPGHVLFVGENVRDRSVLEGFSA